MDELVERLNEAWRKLYGDGDEHGVCDTLAEAATALEAAREDAERYRWLRSMAKERFLDPRAPGGEYSPDMRTHWCIPTLICSGPVGGFMSFDDAIDQARGKGVADEA